MKKSRRLSTYDFLKKRILYLKEKGDQIHYLERKSPLDTFSSERNDTGWWKIIKECIIHDYIGTFLNVLDKQRREEGKKLFFVDLLASNGLCKIKGDKGTRDYYFPGSPLLAALKNESDKYFDKLFLCDLKDQNRAILRQRLDNLNSKLPNKIDYEICDGGRTDDVDSNLIIEDVMEKMKKEAGRKYFALVIIDNQGLDINFDSLRRIHETHNFTDFIINFPIITVKRNWPQRRKPTSPKMIETLTQFCGFSPEYIDMNQIINEYVYNLQKIGKERVEKVEVKGGASVYGFHYFMICAARKTQRGSSWMSMITKLQERFRNISGDTIRELFQTFFGSQKILQSNWGY